MTNAAAKREPAAMLQSIAIRDSRAEDISAITKIYADTVRTSIATFEIDPPDEAEMSRRRDKVVKRNLPYLVAADGNDVIGFCYVGLFHDRGGFKNTLEDTIYIHESYRGQKIGSHLLEELIRRCDEMGYWVILSHIAADSPASIRLHEKYGFTLAGTLSGVGWKFERQLDTVFYQRPLSAGLAQRVMKRA